MKPKNADLRRTEIALWHLLDGILNGEKLGLRAGPGSVPDDIRPYVEGEDEALYIDWVMSSLLEDELFVREMIAERQLETTFIANFSRYMFTGTDWEDKRNTAISAVWSMAYLLNGGTNTIAAAVAHNDNTGTKWFQHQNGQAHRFALVSYLRSIPKSAAGAVDLGKLIDGTRNMLKRNGLVIVVSDFQSPGWKDALRRLTAAGHTVYCIRIIDRRELRFEEVGIITLEDPVTGELLEVNTSDANFVEAYRDLAEVERDKKAMMIFGSHAEYIELRTDGNWAASLISQLQAASRRDHKKGRKVA